ncbi:MAG TPA: hypothetical protein VLK33_03525, partial [Terriglobales bacterium]|nr:hypothetical protein [Terriglobales bacterium]
MSRIFEALQRSEAEKSGGTPLESMLATELLESVDRDSPEPVLNVGQQSFAAQVAAAQAVAAQPTSAAPELGQFQSVPVAISPESRLAGQTGFASDGNKSDMNASGLLKSCRDCLRHYVAIM